MCARTDARARRRGRFWSLGKLDARPFAERPRKGLEDVYAGVCPNKKWPRGLLRLPQVVVGGHDELTPPLGYTRFTPILGPSGRYRLTPSGTLGGRHEVSRTSDTSDTWGSVPSSPLT